MDKFNTENPFRENPESELKRRLQSARPLTQEQFKKRIQEIKNNSKIK